MISYFLFATWHFGLQDGFLVMLLTWSFFVLATPIPDAGIILDLPIRYLFGIKMIFTEIIVWLFAISLNIMSIIFYENIYEKTFVLKLFKLIILHPLPYFLIISFSALGTFFTLYVSDEVYNILSYKKSKKFINHKHSIKFFTLCSVIIFVFVLYDLLLKELGIKIL